MLETAVPARRTSHFSSRAHPLMVAALDDVRDALERRTAQVFDARPAARFHGKAPEPRPGLKSGHMPGSLSLPASDLIENGFLKEPADILAAFESAGADWRTPVITSCGSGVSAAILTLGLVRAGREPGRLYDGSWSEWGARKDLPVARETRDG